jgi:mRNA interferase MazF
MSVKRGDIYLVDWSGGRGHEQAGKRPALIVQNDIGNEFAGTTIVASITTSLGKLYPFMVNLPAGAGGLDDDSAVDCAQIMTIDKSRLGKRLGGLSPAYVAQVNAALKKSLALS